MTGTRVVLAGADSRLLLDRPLMTCVPKPPSRLHIAFNAAICTCPGLGPALGLRGYLDPEAELLGQGTRQHGGWASDAEARPRQGSAQAQAQAHVSRAKGLITALKGAHMPQIQTRARSCWQPWSGGPVLDAAGQCCSPRCTLPHCWSCNQKLPVAAARSDAHAGLLMPQLSRTALHVRYRHSPSSFLDSAS